MYADQSYSHTTLFLLSELEKMTSMNLYKAKAFLPINFSSSYVFAPADGTGGEFWRPGIPPYSLWNSISSDLTLSPLSSSVMLQTSTSLSPTLTVHQTARAQYRSCTVCVTSQHRILFRAPGSSWGTSILCAAPLTRTMGSLVWHSPMLSTKPSKAFSCLKSSFLIGCTPGPMASHTLS